MKKTARAPANIAFVKYWGKSNESLRLPLNSSISMNLSGAYTTTTVEFSSRYSSDNVTLIGEELAESEKQRVVRHIDVIRRKAGIRTPARVMSRNNFPKGTGAAASASGFAALTVAAAVASGLTLTEKELTILARIGSGSACRSVPDGFVLWQAGNTSEDSYAYSLYPESYWDLRDVLVIVERRKKEISSTAGMSNVRSSPFFQSRIDGIAHKIESLKKALEKRDFPTFGSIIEEDCLNMHAVMMTQSPPIFYWSGATLDIVHAVHAWRGEGLPVSFTIDAGPNVHLICEGRNQEEVVRRATLVDGVKDIIVNKPSVGVRIMKEHLF